MYFCGFLNEYLTPACAAKFIVTFGLNFLKILVVYSVFNIDFKNLNFLYLLNIFFF